MNPVTIYYLEMWQRPEPGATPVTQLEVQLVDQPDGRMNEDMYRRVGKAWNWYERLAWSAARWHCHATHPALETWLAFESQRLVGYVELVRQPQGNCLIWYLGLVPEACGRGLGKQLLIRAIDIAWSKPATTRVWLHTCSEDHPHALNNYRKRGLSCYQTVISEAGDPDLRTPR